MSLDHCIITKYELSEKEKEIRKAFFSKKESNDQQTKISKKSQSLENINNILNSKNNEEMINKLIDENFVNKNKITQPIHQTNSNIPLNLIYSQNKILERNVDVLQETQRSIHDLLVYNLKTNKNKNSSETNTGGNIKQMQLIQQMITPLYLSIEEMKKSINQITHHRSNNSKTNSEYNDLNSKVDDMVSKHHNFKETSSKFSKNVENVEKNKQLLKDNQILKAIEDLKTSIGQINTEMNKMENEFGENLKKIVEDKEKQNLRSLMNGVSNAVNSVGNLDSVYGKKHVKGNNSSDVLNYVEYRHELLDINQRKEEILSDFQFNKLTIPKMARPTEKIDFTYKLDFEEQYDNTYKYQKNSNSRMGMSSSSIDKEAYTQKNVFLDNLNSSGNLTRTGHKHNRSMSNTNSNNYTNYANNGSNTKTLNKSQHTRGKSKEEIKNNPIPSIKKSKVIDNNPLFEENFSENNYNTIENKNEEESMSIMDKMTKIKEKMSSYKNSQEVNDEDNKENLLSINPNHSTKHSINRSTEPTSSKYLRSPTVFQKEKKNHHLAVVEEKEDHQNYDDLVIRQIKMAERDLDKNSIDKMRRGISLIEVSPMEKNKHNVLEDIILKLCVEKMMCKGDKRIPMEDKFVEIPTGKKDNNFPFEFHETQVRSITESLFREYLRNLLRGRRRDFPKKTFEITEKNESYIKNSSYNNLESDLVNMFKLENERRDRELANCLNGLMGRFADMEKSLLSKMKNEPQVVSSGETSTNIDIDDMVNKITDKIKSNMQININLTTENKREVPKVLELNRQELQIEGIPKEEEEVHSQSGYTHPFADTRRVDYEEVNKNIPLPHLINLDDYEISSSSYISDTRRTVPPPKNIEKDDSYSEGQIPHSKDFTDHDTSSYLTTPGKNNNSKQNYNHEYLKQVYQNKQNYGGDFDMEMLKKFNQQLQVHLNSLNPNEEATISQRTDTENNLTENINESGYGPSDGNSRNDSSTISINVHKQMLNLNNNENLKTLNLYDSDEHRLFQKQFGGEELLVDTQMTRRIQNEEENTNNLNSGRSNDSNNINYKNKIFSQTSQNSNFKLYRPTHSSGDNHSNSNNNLIQNPTLFSFQGILSRSSERSASASASNRLMHSTSHSHGNNLNHPEHPKFAKINSSEMDNLIARQNTLNDKMKMISRNAGLNNENKINTIPENYSDMEVTINQDKEKENKKVYKTDESSLNISI